MKVFNKLVRDKIPGIIMQQGGQPIVETLEGDAYLRALDQKLIEEITEYQESKELEELADILEVVYAICEARGHTIESLHQIKEEKRLERGGFEARVFLVSAE